MYIASSSIKNLNKAMRDLEILAAEIAKARTHLTWCCQFTPKNICAYFHHEHPRLATSWREPEIQEDPCKKPTGFMSNAPILLGALNLWCSGRYGRCSRPQWGRHVECLGKKAQGAAIFQKELCMAILQGIESQLLADRRMRNDELGLARYTTSIPQSSLGRRFLFHRLGMRVLTSHRHMIRLHPRDNPAGPTAYSEQRIPLPYASIFRTTDSLTPARAIS